MENLEQKLEELRTEKRNIKDQIGLVLSDVGNFDAYTSLKTRSEQIPHQIKFLEIQLQKNKIKDLEEQERQKLLEIETAKQESKDYDLYEAPKIALLKNEAAKINQESLAKLIKPKLIEDNLRGISLRLNEERLKLSNMEQAL